MGRFRRYNLLHAELLGEILEIAPVTPAKVARILAGLDEVVALFGQLFGEQAEPDATEPDARPATIVCMHCRHEVRWDARGLASGTYLVRLKSGERTTTSKLVLVQ